MVLKPSFLHEQQYSGNVAGVDEVGIGSWVGPVYAAAAYVPLTTPASVLNLIDDSKKLTRDKRQAAYEAITQAGVQVTIGSASLQEIEDLNIRGAAQLAMERAISQLDPIPDVLLVDGTMRPECAGEIINIIQGDRKSYSIAVASIIAKVRRDILLKALHQEQPQYGWEANSGYGTRAHQEALKRYGVSAHHRVSYAPIRRALQVEKAVTHP